MAEDWADKSLKRADGETAPQGYDENKGDDGDWDVILLRDGRQLVRDDSVERELKDIKNKMGDDSGGTSKVRPVNGNDDSLFTEDHKGKVQDKDVKDQLKKVNDKLDELIKATKDNDND